MCASQRADRNVSLFTFVYINAVKTLQVSVRAAAVRRGEGCRPRCSVKYGFGDQGRGSRICVRAQPREACPCARISARRYKC